MVIDSPLVGTNPNAQFPDDFIPDLIIIQNGWTGQIRTVTRGNDQVLQIYNWIGGIGIKPPTGYIASTGLVQNIALATNIKGLSAYQVWIALGNQGTEADYINSLTPPPVSVATPNSLAVKRVGDTLYNFYDPNTFETVTFTKSSDTVAEGVLIIQRGSEFFRRNIVGGRINAKWFGVVGDGVVNDTVNLQKALNSASTFSVRNVYIPDGNYMIQAHDPTRTPSQAGFLVGVGGISIPSGVTLTMSGQAYLKAIPTNHVAYNIIRVQQASDVVIEGGNLVGDRTSTQKVGVNGEWGYGVAVLGSSRVTINKVKSTNCWGDGFNLQVVEPGGGQIVNNYDITLNDCIGDNNRRQGLSIEGGFRIKVNRCTFSNTNGTAPQSGLDIEPYSPNNLVDGVVIDNCLLFNNATRNLLIHGAMISNVKVKNTKFTGYPGVGNSIGGEHVTVNLAGTNIDFNQCSFDNQVSLRGGTIRGGKNVSFSNCDLVNCGIQVNESGDADEFITTSFEMRDSRITNDVANGATRGIGGTAVKCLSYSLKRNVFDFSKASEYSFLGLNGPSNYIESNDFINMSVPLIIGDGTDNQVRKNNFYGCDLYALECRMNTIIEKNSFYKCGNKNIAVGSLPGVIKIRNIASNVRILDNIHSDISNKVSNVTSAIPAKCFIIVDSASFGFTDIEVVNNVMQNKGAPTTDVMRTWSNENDVLTSPSMLYKLPTGPIICSSIANLYRGVKPADMVYIKGSGALILIITPYTFNSSGVVVTPAGYVTVNVS